MSRLHERDRRQREPHSSRPLRVAIRMLSHCRVAGPDVACAALLHDAVGRQGALAVLAGQFGGRG
jgi:(p)ppGpp synthase/HD superfamily hydrolase